MDIVNFNMEIFIVVLINLFAMGLGMWVYLVNRKKRMNQWFGIMSLSIVLWVDFAYLGGSTKNIAHGAIWYKLNFAAVSLFLFAAYRFYVLCFLKWGGKNILLEWLVTLGSLLFFVLALFTDLIIKTSQIQEWGTDSVYGSLGDFYNYFAFFVASLIFYYLGRYYFFLNRSEKLKIQYFLIGTFSMIIFNIIFNIIFPTLLHTIKYQHFGDYSSIFLLSFTAYAILKHRFMDIRVVINKSVVYATLTALFVGLTAFFAMLLGNQIASEFTTNILISAAIVAVIIALAFPLLHTLVQSLVDRFIFRPNAHHPYMLQVSKYTLARCDTVVGLANETERLLDESLGVRATLFVLNTFTHEFEPTTRDRGLTRAQTNTLMNLFPRDTRLMFRDDIPRLIAANPYAENLMRDTRLMMQSRRLAAIIPLISAEALLHGLLAIPEKDTAYSQEDASFLHSFATTVERRLADVVAYEHALKGIQELLRQRGRL